ncbi:MAG: HDOD domain-containing protein [Desulfobacterales bacterium]|nr:HDOD domain-containing protein [Desulfobacterales bacterium]
MTAIQILIKEIKNLKPIPAVVHPLLEVVDDPSSDMEDIARIIQYDPAITASVLRTTNSAFFGLKQPAESVKDAANLLGTDQIVDMVLLKSGAKALSGKQEGYDLHEGAMWKYSVSSAIIAKQIATQLDIPNKSSIFTAALLKDIGKTVLDSFVQDAFEKISDLVASENMSFMEAEKKIIGVNHAELGGMIAKMWKFSPRMVKIIRNHHLSDDNMIQDKETAVVYLADCICMMMGMGVGADGLAYRFHEDAMEELDITADEIPRIIAEFTFKMQEVEDLLQVV